VPLSNKDLGYLPWDIDSKLAPYMRPLWDNLKVIQSQFPEEDKQYQQIDQMLQDGKLVIEPLSYIRGRSLQRIFFIVDEAQNLTPHEIKTIITRAGEGVKVVFTGDIFQIDHPYLDSQSNGLSYLIEHFKGQRLYAHINLEKGERSELADLASNLLWVKEMGDSHIYCFQGEIVLARRRLQEVWDAKSESWSGTPAGNSCKIIATWPPAYVRVSDNTDKHKTAWSRPIAPCLAWMLCCRISDSPPPTAAPVDLDPGGVNTVIQIRHMLVESLIVQQRYHKKLTDWVDEQPHGRNTALPHNDQEGEIMIEIWF
jgi:hypothetical protein